MIPILLALAPLAPDNGCRCADLDPTLAAWTRLAALAVAVDAGRVLVCHNGRRGGGHGRHPEGRAVDLVLDGDGWSYTAAQRRFEAGGTAQRAFYVAGDVALATGITWGLAAWDSVVEFGHFERPAAGRWPWPVPQLLLWAIPNAGGCR